MRTIQFKITSEEYKRLLETLNLKEIPKHQEYCFECKKWLSRTAIKRHNYRFHCKTNIVVSAKE